MSISRPSEAKEWYHSQLKLIPVREDPGLVGLCDDDDDSCLKNSLGFMERWDTNAAASYESRNAQ